jgi:hypothetical protein
VKLRAFVMQRIAAVVAPILNPYVGKELNKLRNEVGRLATDNARLQQEVAILSALRAPRA